MLWTKVITGLLLLSAAAQAAECKPANVDCGTEIHAEGSGWSILTCDRAVQDGYNKAGEAKKACEDACKAKGGHASWGSVGRIPARGCSGDYTSESLVVYYGSCLCPGSGGDGTAADPHASQSAPSAGPSSH